MTLSDALNTIVNSTTKDAMKRPAMGGYLYRSEVSTATGTDGDYTLTFKNRAGTTYVYSYDASADTWTAPSTKPDLSGELFGEILGDDWMVGTKEDFEAALNPGPNDVW